MALPGLLAPLVIAGPGRMGPRAVLAPAHGGQTGQSIAVLASGAGCIAHGRTAQWRSCLPLVGLHKDVWDMGTLAVAHPCSPLLVQCGLPWEISPAIVQAPEVPQRRRFQDSPEPPQPGMVPPSAAHTVMQTSVRMGATTVLASDGPCGGRPRVQGFALSRTVPDEATGESLCATLADGGQVHMPLTTTCFVPRFGMVADRFGVSEMVTVARCVLVPPQKGERTGEAQ